MEKPIPGNYVLDESFTLLNEPTEYKTTKLANSVTKTGPP